MWKSNKPNFLAKSSKQKLRDGIQWYNKPKFLAKSKKKCMETEGTICQSQGKNKVGKDYKRWRRKWLKLWTFVKPVKRQRVAKHSRGSTSLDISKREKPKKLRIAKHLRRWVKRKKKVEELVSATSFVMTDESKKGDSNCTVSGTGIPVAERLYADTHQTTREQTDKTSEIKSVKKTHQRLEDFDGSVSMPVLFRAESACFKDRRSNGLETSKSSTRTAEKKSGNEEGYSVVGDSAAIHIDKKRIRLEGKDVVYGSILHKDRDFDDHFKVLKEGSFQDIETQVKKVKERIKFARAMDALNDNSGEKPAVELKHLLLPAPSSERSKTKKELEVVTTTSFYQKFLASMNIMKSIVRSEACDRSVMTDEPFSRTYAEFLSASAAMSGNEVHPPTKNVYSRSTTDGLASGWDRLSSMDSLSNIHGTGPARYFSKMCQCWEPLLLSFRKDSWSSETEVRKYDSPKVDEEKILKAVVNKVLDASRRRKGYIKTDISP